MVVPWLRELDGWWYLDCGGFRIINYEWVATGIPAMNWLNLLVFWVCCSYWISENGHMVLRHILLTFEIPVLPNTNALGENTSRNSFYVTFSWFVLLTQVKLLQSSVGIQLNTACVDEVPLRNSRWLNFRGIIIALSMKVMFPPQMSLSWCKFRSDMLNIKCQVTNNC